MKERDPYESTATMPIMQYSRNNCPTIFSSIEITQYTKCFTTRDKFLPIEITLRFQICIEDSESLLLTYI